MATELTEQERDQMAHAIGHHSAKGCSVHGGRNYYVTSADDSVWLGLVERGLATVRGSSLIPNDERVFHVTEKGRLALEADPRSRRKIEPGRDYVVRFHGYDDCPITVRAETRGKAKSKAASEFDEIFPDGDAFMRIASCRLAVWR